jgi:hypothetical protein
MCWRLPVNKGVSGVAQHQHQHHSQHAPAATACRPPPAPVASAGDGGSRGAGASGRWLSGGGGGGGAGLAAHANKFFFWECLHITGAERLRNQTARPAWPNAHRRGAQLAAAPVHTHSTQHQRSARTQLLCQTAHHLTRPIIPDQPHEGKKAAEVQGIKTLLFLAKI